MTNLILRLFGACAQVFLANHYAHTGIINPVTKTLAYFPAKVFQYKPRKRACSVCQINLAKFVVYEDELSIELPSFWCEVCTKMRGGLEVRMDNTPGLTHLTRTHAYISLYINVHGSSFLLFFPRTLVFRRIRNTSSIIRKSSLLSSCCSAR